MKAFFLLAALVSVPAFAAVQSPIDCFQAAEGALARFGVSDAQKTRLCAAAQTDAPIRCFLTAKGSFVSHYYLTNDEISTVCARAQVAETPLRCVLATVSMTRNSPVLDAGLISTLCAGATTESGPAGCFRVSERFGLSLEERVTLCAGAR